MNVTGISIGQLSQSTNRQSELMVNNGNGNVFCYKFKPKSAYITS